MRCLYSSDQWAPGFEPALLLGGGAGGAVRSGGALRGATLSFNVVRDEVELDDEFESLMQFSGTGYTKLD